MKIKWEKKKVIGNSFIETLILNGNTIQICLFEKINIFKGNNLFGDYDIDVTVFSSSAKIMESEKLEGLNGNLKQAINCIGKLKIKYIEKYQMAQ